MAETHPGSRSLAVLYLWPRDRITKNATTTRLRDIPLPRDQSISDNREHHPTLPTRLASIIMRNSNLLLGVCQERGDRPSVMWRPKGTIKPKGGANIKKKLSGKSAPTLNTKVTLEEFEVYGAQKVTITITKPKPSSNLGYFDSTPHIKGVVKDKVCVFPIINAIHLSSQSIYLTQDV